MGELSDSVVTDSTSGREGLQSRLAEGPQKRAMNAGERRGARLLTGAASLLAAFALISATSRLLANPESWLDELAGCGTILLILYFASRGGSFSIWLIWVLLIFTGFILLVACAAVAIEVYSGRFHESRWALVQHSGAAWVLLGYASLFWVFFLSRSVRAFIRYQRWPYPGPELPKARSRSKLSLSP